MTEAHNKRATRVNLDNCPPNLRILYERYGTAASIAKATGISKYTIRDIAGGHKPMSEKFSAKIEEFLAKPNGAAVPPELPPIVATFPVLGAIPEWDGKRRSSKYKGTGGNIKTEKNLPGPVADLLEKNNASKLKTAQALGYSGWSGVTTVIADNDKYRRKLHEKVIKALRGEVPTASAPVTEPDEYKLGLAIVLMSLSDYERIDEMAAIIGGHRVFRRNTKAGWLVIFRFPHKEKTQQFKRLAVRDASEIVCP